jgi:hypothetical protein
MNRLTDFPQQGLFDIHVTRLAPSPWRTH